VTISLKQLNDLRRKQKYRVEISKRFRVLKNLSLRMILIQLWELLERIYKMWSKSIGHYKLKKPKPWLNERCSKLLDPREKASCALRPEDCRHFSKESKECLKDRVNELPADTTNKNMRGAMHVVGLTN
jgi:hypothetical protein